MKNYCSIFLHNIQNILKTFFLTVNFESKDDLLSSAINLSEFGKGNWCELGDVTFLIAFAFTHHCPRRFPADGLYLGDFHGFPKTFANLKSRTSKIIS